MKRMALVFLALFLAVMNALSSNARLLSIHEEKHTEL